MTIIRALTIHERPEDRAAIVYHSSGRANLQTIFQRKFPFNICNCQRCQSHQNASLELVT